VGGREATHDDSWKERLTTYNLDDCAALKKVAEFIATLNAQATSPAVPPLNGNAAFRVASVAEIDKLARPRKTWGPVDFFHSDYDYINKCAYFDYQRERVYVRTSKTKRKRKARGKKHRNSTLRVTKCVEITASRCPCCKSTDVERNVTGAKPGVSKPTKKRAFDLAVTPSGIRRKVIEYTSEADPNHWTAVGVE